jgi:hypothetical protein
MGLLDNVFGKKPAKTPDPYQTAAAQTQNNQQTANYNAALNRVDQVTPYGSSTYAQNGTDASGAPHYTQTTTLSPLAQQELDNEMRQDSTLSNLGYNLADQAKGTLSSGIDTSKLPALSGAPGATGHIQTSVGGTGAITDFGAQTKAAQDAVYGQYKSRLDPQWANTQNENDTKLANMGVMFNSSAYGKNQTQLDQAKNDAYQQANYQSVLAGSQEAQRLYGDQLAGSQFANQAQAQQYAQALQNSQFNNQARAQGLQEQTSLRDLPINELNALRSSTQIQNPNFSAVPQSTAAGTDISGNIYKSAQLQNDNFNNMMNGIYSMASSAAMASDRRVKRNIRRIGITDHLRLPLYAYQYVWDRTRTRVGVMADEVLSVAPHAVLRHPEGYLMVDYGMIS